MRIIIHETYEYEVEANSIDEAVNLFDRYREDEDNTGVIFNQNYLHTYDSDMKEI